ncbi:DNA polymerase III subunit epsilon [Propionibacterium sp. NM47_B9-13]|nr:DNA polymerase III subunit epsilon [Cutibacterium modestum]TGY27751.1 DNA polymerase III subunit epsilon [Propionibacterium sp. NM47_B9-13]
MQKTAHHDAHSLSISAHSTALTRLFSVFHIYSRRCCRHVCLPC